MASYRNISMDFWTDSKVVDDFTPEDRYIYLYCMTNPHTNLCGCYEVSIKQIANETGYNNDSVERRCVIIRPGGQWDEEKIVLTDKKAIAEIVGGEAEYKGEMKGRRIGFLGSV